MLERLRYLPTGRSSGLSVWRSGSAEFASASRSFPCSVNTKCPASVALTRRSIPTLGVSFQFVVHPAQAEEAEFVETSTFLGRAEWTSIRMPA
jgi:hypothetical protein